MKTLIFLIFMISYPRLFMALIKGMGNSAQARNSIMNSKGGGFLLPVVPTKGQKSAFRRQAADPGAVYANMSLPRQH